MNHPPTLGDRTEKIAALSTDRVVVGQPGQQFGLPYLTFQCPRCGVPFALAGPGHHICHCGTVLDVREPEKASS